MSHTFAELRDASRTPEPHETLRRMAEKRAATPHASGNVVTGNAAKREMRAMEKQAAAARRQKLADGGPVFSNWESPPPPTLPSFSIDSSEGRKGATDFNVGYGLGDISASGNYQKNTDGGRDTYGGRLTFRKSFAAGGAAKPQPKR